MSVLKKSDSRTSDAMRKKNVSRMSDGKNASRTCALKVNALMTNDEKTSSSKMNVLMSASKRSVSKMSAYRMTL